MPEVRSVILEVAGRSREAQRSLQGIQRQIQELQPGATFRVNADVNRARRNLAEMRKELRSVDRTQVAPEVSVQIGAALVKLEALDQQIARLPRQKTIDIEIRRGILSDLNDIEGGVVSVVRGLDRASRPARTFGDRLGEMAQTVKSLVPVLNGLAVLLGVKLVGGLVALAASAAAAVGGVIALGAAFVATLGPAVALFLALVNRMAKVLEALKLQDQARDAAQRKTAEGSKAAAQAAEQRLAAEEGVRDALQGVTTAERGLAEARRSALEAIRNAQQQAADAARGLRDATASLAEATVAAFREMENAAERVTQALLDVRDARLGLAEARLDIRQIRNEMRKLGRDLGITGGNLNGLLERATDVSFDPSRLREMIGSFAPEDADQTKALEMEELILRLRRAKLDEDEATNTLKTSERDLARAREENAKFQREGINAYGPLRDAVQALETARRRANDAEREANRLTALGVENAPSVVSALEGLRDAEEQLAAARRRRGAAVAEGTADAQERARQATEKLTASEMKFLAVLQRVRKELTGFFAPAVDRVFGAMTRALDRAPQMLMPLQEAFTELGQAWADVIDAFSTEFVKPEWTTAFRALTFAAADFARIIGGDIFVSFARILRDIALATLPAMTDLLRDFADAMRRVAAYTSETSNIAPIINTMVESFRVWMRLLVAIGNAITGLIQAAAPIGDEFVGWIGDALNGLAAWLRSAEGQEKVREFFEDTIPSVKALLGFLVRLGRVFLQLIQFFSPFLEGGLSVMNTVLDLFSAFLTLLNDIVSNPWGRAIRYALGQFFALRTVVVIFNALVGLISRVASTLITLPSRLAGLGASLLAPFRTAFTTLRGIVGAVVNAIAGAFGRMVTFIRERVSAGFHAIVAIFAALPQAFGDIVGAALAVVTGLFTGILAAARALGQPLIDAGRALVDGFLIAFRGLAGFIEAIFSAVLAGIRGAVNLIIDAVNFVIDRINDIPNIPTPFGSIGIPDIPNIPKLALGGLVTSPTLAMLGERAGLQEAVLPLTDRVMGRLARALAAQLSPGLALAGGGYPSPGARTVINNNTFNIPRPLDATKSIDAENTAALLQQAWEGRGGGLS